MRNIIPKKQYDFHQKSILIRAGWKIFHYMRFAIYDILNSKIQMFRICSTLCYMILSFTNSVQENRFSCIAHL